MTKRNIRIIPKLDIKNGLLIKGINLEGLRVLGQPNDFAKYYYDNGADEIYYLDNVATLYGIPQSLKYLASATENIFVPFGIGGGIKSLIDIENILKKGGDKVIVNSSFHEDKKFLKAAPKTFGTSTIVALIESVKIENQYYVSKYNGRELIKKNPLEWAKDCETSGVGEIFLTSVNNEGLQKGFDIEIIEKITNSVNIPVIAHGGAGSIMDIYKLINQTNVSGVGISSLLHYDAIHKFKKRTKLGNNKYIKSIQKSEQKTTNILIEIKNFLKKKGINVR